MKCTEDEGRGWGVTNVHYHTQRILFSLRRKSLIVLNGAVHSQERKKMTIDLFGGYIFLYLVF